MDFHLATPNGDVYLFSHDGRAVQIPAADGQIEQQSEAAHVSKEIEAMPE